MGSPVPRLCEADPVTILSGQSLSASFNLGGRIIAGAFVPSAWTAAVVTFQASWDNVTFSDVQTAAGAEYSLTATAGKYLAADPVMFYGVNFVKVRSGTSAAPVNQAADRSVVLMTGVPDQ